MGEIEQNDLNLLYKSVAYRIAQNEPKSSIITDLMQQGWNQERDRHQVSDEVC